MENDFEEKHYQRIIVHLDESVELSMALMGVRHNLGCCYRTEDYQIQFHDISSLLNVGFDNITKGKDYAGFTLYALRRRGEDLEIKKMGSLFEISYLGLAEVINPKNKNGDGTIIKDSDMRSYYKTYKINPKNPRKNSDIIELLGRELTDKESFHFADYFDRKWRAGIFSIFSNSEYTKLSIGNPFNDWANEGYRSLLYPPKVIIDYQGKRCLSDELMKKINPSISENGLTIVNNDRIPKYLKRILHFNE